MAEYDEIRVGNLYHSFGDRYFVILKLKRLENILAIPVSESALVEYDIRKNVNRPVKTTKQLADIRLEDTTLELEILFVKEQRIETRKTTVSQFWAAYNCVAEVS